MKTYPRSPPPRPPVNKITHDSENITFPQLRLRAVKTQLMQSEFNYFTDIWMLVYYMSYNDNVCEHDVVQHLGLSVYFYIQMMIRYNS